MQANIMEIIDLLYEQEIEAGHLRQGETSVILTWDANAGDRGFKALIQRPGREDEVKQLDEGELLSWWMHFKD